MSDSVQPHRRQPTRLPRPWDSSGKSTGVGCHFLLQCMKVKSASEAAQSCLTLCDPMDCSPPGSSIHGSFQARVLEWGAIAFSHLHARSSKYSCWLIILFFSKARQKSHFLHEVSVISFHRALRPDSHGEPILYYVAIMSCVFFLFHK